MSSFIKSKLKASRDALQAKDWQSAIEAADEVLESESNNYNAHVFKALALLNENKKDESENLYRKAIEIQPSQQLAWQGLEKLLTETKQWDKLITLLEQLMDQSVKADDATKCAEHLQKLVQIQRDEGSSSQLAESLSFYLPSSPYYATLSTLSSPDQTNPTATTTFDAQMAIHHDSFKVLNEIIQLKEESEQRMIDRETEKRKNRLESMSKSREVLKNEIGLEVWRTSKLPELYDQVLCHIQASDEARRGAEHKLLLYRYNILKALPNPAGQLAGPSGTAATSTKSTEDDIQHTRRKKEALESVQELANGIVSINVPDELAWSIVLEWQDVLHLADLDRQRLRAYIHHFPRSGLSKSLEALLVSIKDKQFLEERKKRQEEEDVEVHQPDPLTLALDGLEQAPESLLAHRIAAILYFIDRDWMSCSELASAALSVLRRLTNELGISLEGGTRPSLESLLAISLTFIHPPQHHSRASRLCEEVLSKDNENLEASMAKGTILQTANKWKQAREVFSTVIANDEKERHGTSYEARRALSLFKSPDREARLEVAWCDVQLGQLEDAQVELRAVIEELDTDKEANVQDQAKAYWRLGQCLWNMGGHHREDREQAFSCFITALKRDAAYAPAFTSLGLFYATVSEPKDPQRASKCFQKAFELDARENEAAKRLAEMYAEEEDWDLVDLVARRTIEAEGGSWMFQQQSQSSISTTAQRRHTTKNAWAWNAIGSTELARTNYERAIVAFQVALRSFPDNHGIWMRLGDAYLASGRQSAAIKTYERARQLQSDQDAWQAAFSIANVQKELGMYEEAIELFQLVSKEKSDLAPVKIALAETKLQLALQQGKQGYVDRSRKGLYSAIVIVLRVLESNKRNTACWKVVADGISHLCRMDRISTDVSFIEKVMSKLSTLSEEISTDEKVPAISSVTKEIVFGSISKDKEFTAIDLTRALQFVSAYVCKIRISLIGEDEELAGSAWLDLCVALQDLSNDMRQRNDFSYEQDDQIHLGKDEAIWKETQAQAIACAKEALKLEPGNGMYWCTLGTLVFDHGVPLAQHCFIKAIECDSKDITAWTNLGFLYLVHEDFELANEAFVRAQTMDSEFVQAWVGQALVADQRGNDEASRAFYRHAFTIDQEGTLEAIYGFANSTFKHMRNTNEPSNVLMNNASSALSLYLSRRSNDVSALHLSALFAERLGQSEEATERIHAASTILEYQYEQEESTEKAQLFAICMSNLGRIHLSCGRYEKAIESMEMCLGLLEGSTNDANSEQHKTSLHASKGDLERARLNAHCTIGLAYFGIGDSSAAIASLQQSLEDLEGLRASLGVDLSSEVRSGKETISILIARILWSQNKQEEGENVLMDILADDPQAFDAMIILTVMSWLTNNEEQLEAVQSDLMQLYQIRKTQFDGISLNDATTLFTLLDLYNGDVQSALMRLRSDAKQSLSARRTLVQTLLRLTAQDENNEAQEALQESQSYTQAVRNSSEANEDSIGQALRMESVAKLLYSKQTETETDPTMIPSISALEAIKADPCTTSSLFILRDTLIA
jgi:superkiller protein 3